MNIPEIFVLWHPSCHLGEALARRIHAWLRPGNGLGPQVYYRSLPAPDAPPGALPPPLHGEMRGLSAPTTEESAPSRITNLQIVIALIDEHMVADQAWRHWLVQLRTPGTSKRRTMLPVALDATAYNAPAELRELNYLRPAGLPLSTPVESLKAYEQARLSQNPPDTLRKQAEPVESVVRSLLKQLTETLTRLLLPRARSDGATLPDTGDLGPPKVSVFLSHAKADGRVPAQRLRDYIYSQTQMAAFFDENDIAFSSVFSKVLNTSLESPTTAAMIAIRSARYAERPWCRREVSLFRKPRRVENTTSAAGSSEQWRLHPLVVVEAMEDGAKSLGVPEFGNAPAIRWSPQIPDIEEQIVTRIIRDALLAAYHAAVAATIPPATGRRRLVLNWLPDPTTLLHVLHDYPHEDLEVIYPGQGLSGAELDVLDEFFPRIWFYSFEEVLS